MATKTHYLAWHPFPVPINYLAKLASRPHHNLVPDGGWTTLTLHGRAELSGSDVWHQLLLLGSCLPVESSRQRA